MVDSTWNAIVDLLTRGGWVMWPLGALSLVALTLIFERCWFWIVTNHPMRIHRCDELGRCLRAGRTNEAVSLIGGDRTPYGRAVTRLLDEPAMTDAAVYDAIESQRHRLERFMPTLGTIITAAPMLGILGTVTGIISAFKILGEDTITDPSQVAAGIAEALITTVAGLVIALIVLFPFNAFRAQIDRTLSRMESLAAAAQAGAKATKAAPAPTPRPAPLPARIGDG